MTLAVHGDLMRIAAFFLAVGVAASATSCGDVRERGPEVAATTTDDESPAVGSPGCDPPTPTELSASGFLEARGTGVGRAAWALLWVEPPWRSNQEVKVVWRMSGGGDLRIVAHGPADEVIEPSQGPTRHSGSNWNRPGAEWGTFFALPTPGCWTLAASNGDFTSRVFLIVTN